MIYLIILLICLPLLFLIVRSGKRGKLKDPKAFAQDLARAQLTALQSVQEKHPDLGREEQYFEAMASITRTTFTEENIKSLISETMRKKRGALRFKDLVSQLVIWGYLKKTGQTIPDVTSISAIMDGVASVISDDI